MRLLPPPKGSELSPAIVERILFMKKYFSCVPFMIAVIINILLGMLTSGPFLFGVVFFGGFFSTPTSKERLIGILIMLAIIIAAIVVNYLTFKICQYKRKNEIKSVSNRSFLKGLIIIIIFIVCVMSFYTMPSLWLWLNGWWF